jgi:hypothetical protein
MNISNPIQNLENLLSSHSYMIKSVFDLLSSVSALCFNKQVTHNLCYVIVENYATLRLKSIENGFEPGGEPENIRVLFKYIRAAVVECLKNAQTM